jgi:hypothetical protein
LSINLKKCEYEGTMHRVLLILCFTIYGCSPLAATQNQALNSVGSIADANTCPKQPSGTLNQSDVKEIALTTTEINETGQIRAGQSFGYVFEAKAKQKLTFSTKENLCLYVYTPSNQLLNGSELPENGKYTIQVAIPSGSTTFNLAMKLGSDEVTVNTPPKEKVLPPSQQSKPPTTPPQVSQPITSQNIRVSFNAGTVGSSIQGSVTPSQVNRYLVNCGGGQSLSIRVIEGSVNFNIIDPDGRNIGTVKNGFWRGKLPMNGDYALEVSSSNVSSYRFDIEVL